MSGAEKRAFHPLVSRCCQLYEQEILKEALTRPPSLLISGRLFVRLPIQVKRAVSIAPVPLVFFPPKELRVIPSRSIAASSTLRC